MCVCAPQLALIASLPVFVATNYTGLGPDPAWRLPPSRGNCSVPECVNATDGTRWYGTVRLTSHSP